MYWFSCFRFMKLCKKLIKFTEVFAPFVFQNWDFTNNNVQELFSNMSIADQQSFNFDMKQVDWDRHAETSLMGLRVYMLKDPASTLPQARIKWQRFVIQFTSFTQIYLNHYY